MYRVNGSIAEKYVKVKSRLLVKLEARLSAEEARRAREDHHAKREPIACGLTVHTGIGCSYGCLYCYVPDMGFPMKPTPYPLSGEQLVYALLSNPYFVPGRHGTMLAFGSVTEPFLEETRSRAFEYLRAAREYLGNPTQIATKAYLSRDDAEAFVKHAEPEISVLVTIVTLRYASRLEPGAPPPEKRFETIRNLSELGVHVTLFLRPIIPGVSEAEARDILYKAMEAGARGVVPGTLRVTPGILRRLEAAGIPVGEIVRLLPRKPRNRRDQVPIRGERLKKIVVAEASRLGLRVFPSSCSANMDSHKLSCWICKWGPCGKPENLPVVDEEGVVDFAEALIGRRPTAVKVKPSTITVYFTKIAKRDERILYHWLSTLSKRGVVIKSKAGK